MSMFSKKEKINKLVMEVLTSLKKSVKLYLVIKMITR